MKVIETHCGRNHQDRWLALCLLRRSPVRLYRSGSKAIPRYDTLIAHAKKRNQAFFSVLFGEWRGDAYAGIAVGRPHFDGVSRERAAWNAGKKVGTKRPLTRKQIWGQHARLVDEWVG
jgi:hypothetical protein